MSGTLPEDQAGLFVLGALNAEEMRAVRVEAGRNADLAAEIADWERRLAPLARLVAEVIPPFTLWTQLETRLTRLSENASAAPAVYQPPAQRQRSRSRRPPEALAFWKSATAAAMALAALLAVYVVVRHPAAPPSLAMLMPVRPGEGGWLVEVGQAGVVKVRAVGALSRGLNQDYQLWVLPDGSDHPVSVGLMPTNDSATMKLKSLPRTKYQLLVSLEPKGGSPTGLPTGPVEYGGVVVPP